MVEGEDVRFASSCLHQSAHPVSMREPLRLLVSHFTTTSGVITGYESGFGKPGKGGSCVGGSGDRIGMY